ncbi:MAG: hypothetical protein ACLST7_03325 [Oscillospiraceae bacterium]|jgi:hypothetical protein|nr:MAG: hypothetical protein BHW33_03950 [Firmicutes bacterium CAG:137_57_8]CDB31055.1 putative uncharacterized protein [Firmicutes bacterium CAG:137]
METKEKRFGRAWEACWTQMDLLDIPTVRMRELASRMGPCAAAHRILTGRRCSDGFDQLARMGKWELSLEALALKPQWGELFSDEEANEALHRLMEAGCRFL